ncbi:aminodeoxychorismate synthase, component I [Hypericibacter adhaerens]|uniref:Probable branched-chain-amino-acid aminotransferase n=1 Tax=Hypericibacter adhaerens TaxID=2602016 RepID=A0A5J6N221_9PROT|nr:aminodeoxychorismate synthase component I [Hypericibacter adhaerens]QEX22630.1 aminodeoxychorismate synthase, component I [Hypericibacter adhaerens]
MTQLSLPLRPRGPYVLLDDNRSPEAGSRLYADPVEILRCDDPADVEAVLARLAGAPSRGLHAAGFLSYELGYVLEPKLAPLMPAGRAGPLIWMGLFREPVLLSRAQTAAFIDREIEGPHRLGEIAPSWDRAAYGRAFRQVREYIAAGDVYQINLTFKLGFEVAGDPLSLYRELRAKQHVAYGAVIRTEADWILSLSPELFVRIEDDRAIGKPMKGTAARGRTPEEDEAARAFLRSDEKSRAENLMIVDLIRNDLGRIARIGSVKVAGLFEVETYETVHQMISTVAARLLPGIGPDEVIRRLFPCGSITGAPKVRAMEIIRELEAAPREVYTGAVGWMAPDGDLCLNVAIRTLRIDAQGRAEMGIGSGLVYDSDEAAEYEECLLKARFLTEPHQPFELIETLLWQRGQGWTLMERHLERLERSAGYFGFPCDPETVRAQLEAASLGFSGACCRVRLLLDREGAIRITATVIPAPSAAGVLRYVLSDRVTDSRDPFLYHKTTRRALYDGEHERWARETGCDEVIFLNERGELTEGSRTNLFIERGGRLLTPPLSSGLLDGTLRRELLATGRAQEAVLTLEDLARAEHVFLGNSVRGLQLAERLAQQAAAV